MKRESRNVDSKKTTDRVITRIHVYRFTVITGVPVYTSVPAVAVFESRDCDLFYSGAEMVYISYSALILKCILTIYPRTLCK